MLIAEPFAPLDLYCERTDASFWSEPLNAVTNGAFLVAAAWALVLWTRAGGRDPAALWLILVTALVGVGSFLFHTLANRWSLLADVLPIAVFIYSYFFVALRRFLGVPRAPAVLATAAFMAFATSFEGLWRAVIGAYTLNGSVGYGPAVLALFAVGALVLARPGLRRGAGRALTAAGAVFLVSLAFRTADEAVCPVMTVGTHSLWHALNAIVLFVLMRAAITFRRGSAGSGTTDATWVGPER
jgi:hypothetical protein